MPLVIRGADRKQHHVPGVATIEVVDNEGRLAVVVIQAAGGSVQIISPTSPQFQHYCRQVGATPTKVHVHERI